MIAVKKLKVWYLRYERILIPATLVLGVLVDAFTFTSINTTTALSLLVVYLLLAGGAMLFLHAYDDRTISHNKIFGYIRVALPLLIQFLFGALLSGVFIFYFFSGTIFVSWPFIGLLVFLMVGNDVFREYYLRPLVQVSVYFFIVLSCFSVILPFLVEAIGVGIFIGSGILAVVFMALFLVLLFQVAPTLRFDLPALSVSLVSLFAVIQVLYIFHFIPPIPLSLREAVISHGVSRSGGEYVLLTEPQSLLDRVLPGVTFHRVASEPVSVFTAIFAPGALETRIVHHWQWYDESTREWVSKDRLSFVLSGGRQEGFRGYSTKTSVEAGAWRVLVETERGAVLGRVRFDVVASDSPIFLQTELR